jgi:hypothetical protein
MTENWNYEVAFNYSQFDEDTIVRGNMNMQRFGLPWTRRQPDWPGRLPLTRLIPQGHRLRR